jgi:cysteine-rich repeat protein
MPSHTPTVRIASLLAVGAVTLGLAAPAHAFMCGDGTPDPNETCDDQNVVSGDGCSATCQVEPGYACQRPNVIQNGDFEQGVVGFFTAYAPDTGTQTEAACGGQRRYPLLNKFLLGNASLACTGHGGSAKYLHISGGGTVVGSGGNRGDTNVIWRQTLNTNGKRHILGFAYLLRVPDAYHAQSFLDVHINGTRVYRFDQPQVPAGYSNATWHTRTGIVISEPSSPTTVLEFRQYGVNNRPEIALDSISMYGPHVCQRLCGNGVLDPGEACDDGNNTKGDGCFSCQVGAGYTCSGQPSVCVPATLQTAPAR